MKTPSSFDYLKAKQYALKRLETELPPNLSYHSVFHTRDDVVPATETLAQDEKISGVALSLLLTAAWFHDLGYVEQMDDHEQAGIRIAVEVLPRFGYASREIEIISGMIAATRMPQAPQTHLETILADADLDSLGREDYWERSLDLWAELNSLGHTLTETEWCQRQLNFLQSHQYFTPSARRLREACKQENILFLKAKLAEISNENEA